MCGDFVHIPKDKRSKLDNKSRQYIFLRYPNEEFSYRLWDPIAKKIVRNVVFLEDQTMEDTKKLEK